MTGVGVDIDTANPGPRIPSRDADRTDQVPCRARVAVRVAVSDAASTAAHPSNAPSADAWSAVTRFVGFGPGGAGGSAGSAVTIAWGVAERGAVRSQSALRHTRTPSRSP